MLLLFWATQAAPASAGYINLSTVLGDLWPALNATSEQDAVFWTAAEIFNHFDESAKRMARRFACFVIYDKTLVAATGQAAYNLPTRYISAQQADLAGFVLRPLNLQEVESLDADWPTTQGSPTHFLLDTAGLTQLALYPIADTDADGKAIGLVMNSFPPDITQAAGILSAPAGLQDYFKFYALGEARGKESRAQMQEGAQFFRGLVDFMEQTLDALYGSAT